MFEFSSQSTVKTQKECLKFVLSQNDTRWMCEICPKSQITIGTTHRLAKRTEDQHVLSQQ